jgi:hypothetical protein
MIERSVSPIFLDRLSIHQMPRFLDSDTSGYTGYLTRFVRPDCINYIVTGNPVARQCITSHVDIQIVDPFEITGNEFADLNASLIRRMALSDDPAYRGLVPEPVACILDEIGFRDRLGYLDQHRLELSTDNGFFAKVHIAGADAILFPHPDPSEFLDDHVIRLLEEHDLHRVRGGGRHVARNATGDLVALGLERVREGYSYSFRGEWEISPKGGADGSPRPQLHQP